MILRQAPAFLVSLFFAVVAFAPLSASAIACNLEQYPDNGGCAAGSYCADSVGGNRLCYLGTAPENAQGSPTQSAEQQSNTTTSGGATNNQGGLTNPLKADNLNQLLVVIMRGVVQITTILLVLSLMWTGFLFVYAQGNEEKIRDARTALFWTVIGGILVLGIQTITQVLERTVQNL